MKLRLATLFLCLLASPAAFAERADRDKPLQLEANKVSIDDAKKIQILEGDVVLIKGTMILKADRVVVTEDRYGFQKGTAFGGKGSLAKFRQKREGREEYIDGEAERIEYDTNSEVLELFHRAWVKNGEDQLKGDYIWYDTVSEKYLVTAGENRDPKGPPPRVRATIQPKSKGTPVGPAGSRGEGLDLKGSGGLIAPPERD
ncbi:MAG: OstA-like protein [Proteobacteria bacterium]|nr:OstA-like protein [Pseudomonadota bacterium]